MTAREALVEFVWRLLAVGAGLISVAVPAFAHASPPPITAAAHASTPAMQAGRIATLEQYLEAFEASYRPGDHELAALYVAEAALAGAVNELAPQVTFGQRLVWDEFAALSLDLEAGVELPLLSPTAAAERDLAGIDLAVQRHAQLMSHQEARSVLLLDLANLAVTTWALQLVTEAVQQVEALGLPWLPEPAVRDQDDQQPSPARRRTPPTTHELTAPLDYVPPAERDAFDAVQRLFDTHRWLGEQSSALYARLSESLSTPIASLMSPSLTEIERYLRAQLAGPAAVDARTISWAAGACRDSPLLEAARLRHVQGVAGDALLALPEYSLVLNARVGGAPGGDLSAVVGVEARYYLPDRWPLAGNAAVDVRPDGLEQRLDLAWPPLPRPRQLDVDRDRELNLALEGVAAELRSLRRAWLLAQDDRARLEQRLGWLLLDASPRLDEAALRSAVETAVSSAKFSISTGAAGDPFALLEVTELRLQIAFARLAEIDASVQYLTACLAP